MIGPGPDGPVNQDRFGQFRQFFGFNRVQAHIHTSVEQFCNLMLALFWLQRACTIDQATTRLEHINRRIQDIGLNFHE